MISICRPARDSWDRAMERCYGVLPCLSDPGTHNFSFIIDFSWLEIIFDLVAEEKSRGVKGKFYFPCNVVRISNLVEWILIELIFFWVVKNLVFWCIGQFSFLQFTFCTANSASTVNFLITFGVFTWWVMIMVRGFQLEDLPWVWNLLWWCFIWYTWVFFFYLMEIW